MATSEQCRALLFSSISLPRAVTTISVWVSGSVRRATIEFSPVAFSMEPETYSTVEKVQAQASDIGRGHQ